MAFAIADMTCIHVGPSKLWLYVTTDRVTASTSPGLACDEIFNTTSVPGLSAGDFMLVKNDVLLDFLYVTAVNTVGCSLLGLAKAAVGSGLGG